MELHEVRNATEQERKIDCCGDRYPCNVEFVCSCNKQACTACMKGHIFRLHYFPNPQRELLFK